PGALADRHGDGCDRKSASRHLSAHRDVPSGAGSARLGQSKRRGRAVIGKAVIRKFLAAAVLGLAGLGMAQPATADPLARSVFGAAPGPTGGAPVSIGFYSKGCVSGAMQLPESGPTWQAMRLSRNRNWGHPE